MEYFEIQDSRSYMLATSGTSVQHGAWHSGGCSVLWRDGEYHPVRDTITTHEGYYQYCWDIQYGVIQSEMWRIFCTEEENYNYCISSNVLNVDILHGTR